MIINQSKNKKKERSAVAILLAAGKGFKKTKCPAVKIPFSKRLKVFYLHLE